MFKYFLGILLTMSGLMAQIPTSSIKLFDLNIVSTELLGTLRVNGKVGISYSAQNDQIDSISSYFKIKVLGFGVYQDETGDLDLEYGSPIDLISGDEIAMNGFNTNDVFAQMVVDQPLPLFNKTRTYNFKIKYIKAFGSAAQGKCRAMDSLAFRLVQTGKTFSVYYGTITAPVSSIKIGVKLLGAEKELSYIEVNTAKSSEKIRYSACKKL